MRVLAREGLTVSFYDAEGKWVPHKRITSQGLIDNRTGITKEGPVEQPETDTVIATAAAGDLIRQEE